MKLLMPLADGFEEIEAMTAISVVRSSGIGLDLVGVVGSVIPGCHGACVMMDKRLGDVKVDDYEGIVIPGGGRGTANLEKSKAVLDMIKTFHDRGKLVAGICYAPLLMAKAGVLDNRKATVYPGREKDIPYPRSERVVVDGNVITSQGPATSLEFALAIVEYFLGKQKTQNLGHGLLVC